MQQWLSLGHTTSPKSGALLPNTVLVPNHDLRARVQEWMQVGGGIGRCLRDWRVVQQSSVSCCKC